MAKIDLGIKEFREEWRSIDRNAVAAILSIVPGAGHLYKHHYVAGFGILIGGNLLMVFIALLLGLATFGLSLLVVPLLYWGMVGAAAYSLPDWHGRHHYLHPWQSPSEEEPPR